MYYLQAVLISNCTSKPTFTKPNIHGKRTYILSVLKKNFWWPKRQHMRGMGQEQGQRLALPLKSFPELAQDGPAYRLEATWKWPICLGKTFFFLKINFSNSGRGIARC